MTPRGRPVEEDDLHARLDGQLPRDRIEDVDAYLAAHPEVEARFSEYAAQRAVLRAALAAQAGGPISARLRVANILHERLRRRHRRLAQIAAAVSLLVLGGIAGWAVRDRVGPLGSLPPGAVARTVTADAIAAHRTFAVEVRHPVEVDAGQEAHLVQWLSKRLGRQLVMPDLTVAGFRLMGGGGCLPRTDPRPNSCTRTAMASGGPCIFAPASVARRRSAIMKGRCRCILLVG
jgi:anti-sigma factor RsiW